MAIYKTCKHCGLEFDKHDGDYCPNQLKKFEPANSLDDVEPPLFDYTQKVIDLKMDVIGLKHEINSLTEDNETLRGLVECTEKELGERFNLSEAQRETIDRQHEIIEDRDKDIRRQKDTIRKLRTVITELEDKLKDKDNELNPLKDCINDLARKLALM